MESMIKISSAKNLTQIADKNEYQNNELNIIILNEDNISLINSLKNILLNQKFFIQKQELSTEPYFLKETKYFFTNDTQITHIINLIEINSIKISEFSFFNNFFISMKKSKNILLIKMKNTIFDVSEYNNNILNFLSIFNSNLIFLIDIKLLFDSKSDKNFLDSEHQNLEKNKQLFFFQEYLETKNFSNYYCI